MGNINVCLEEPLKELLKNYDKKYREDARNVLLRLISGTAVEKKSHLGVVTFGILTDTFVNMSKSVLSDEFKKSWRKATLQSTYGSIEYRDSLLTFEYEEMGEIWKKTWKLSYDALSKEVEKSGYFYLKKTCRHKNKKRDVIYTTLWSAVSRPFPAHKPSTFKTFTKKNEV